MDLSFITNDLGTVGAVMGTAIPGIAGWVLKFKQANALKEIKEAVAAYDELTTEYELAIADKKISPQEQEEMFKKISYFFTELNQAVHAATSLIPGKVGDNIRKHIPTSL